LFRLRAEAHIHCQAGHLTYRPPDRPILIGEKKSKKTLAPSEAGVTLISFWGEQKPVATLVATGFNFFREVSFFQPAHQAIMSPNQNQRATFFDPLRPLDPPKDFLKKLLHPLKPVLL